MTTNTKSQRSIVPLLTVMLFDHTSLNITFPILTLIFFDTQSSLFSPDTSQAVRSMWYGLCVAVPHIVNIITTPLLSALSDEFGRKKILLVGTLGAFLFAITAGLGVYFGILSLFFLGRIIQGAFSRTNPVGQAVIGDISPKEKKIRHMGYLQSSISIGACIGPIIGGYFANQFLFPQLNFSLPYFIAAFFAGISCLLTIFVFQETLTLKKQRDAIHFFGIMAHKKVLLNPHVLQISGMLLLIQTGWSLYYQFMPPILKTNLGFDAHALGLFVGLIAFWLAIATTFGIKFLEKFFSLAQIFLLSMYLVLFGLLLSGIFCWLNFQGMYQSLIWLAAIPTAAGDVIAYSCITTLYSNAVGKEEQGKVMGVCFIVVAIIWALTGILGGALMSYNTLLPLFVAPLGIIFSILLVHFGIGKNIYLS